MRECALAARVRRGMDSWANSTPTLAEGTMDRTKNWPEVDGMQPAAAAAAAVGLKDVAEFVFDRPGQGTVAAPQRLPVFVRGILALYSGAAVSSVTSDLCLPKPSNPTMFCLGSRPRESSFGQLLLQRRREMRPRCLLENGCSIARLRSTAWEVTTVLATRLLTVILRGSFLRPSKCSRLFDCRRCDARWRRVESARVPCQCRCCELNIEAEWMAHRNAW